MSIIEAVDLTKIYRSKGRNLMALDALTLTVQPGSAVGVLGPAGAGKTTLARMIAGLNRPTAGSVTINGLPASDQRSRLGLAYLPDHPEFPGHLSVLGALELSGRLHSVPEDEIEGRAEALLEKVDLGKWADAKVRKCSSDMLRRLALASSLIGHPDLLIVDDPPQKVDRNARDVMVRVLQRARGKGITLMILTRSLAHLEKLVGQVVILNRGRIIRSAPIADLTIERPQMEIEADIGETLIDLPTDLGRVVAISRRKLIVELKQEDDINEVIDYLRLSRIAIHSVQRRKASPDAGWQELMRQEEEVVR